MIDCAVVIPVFNHHHKLTELLTLLTAQQLTVFVIDDGSDPSSLAKVKKITAAFEGVTLCAYQPNKGKGAAVMKGMILAHQAGHSHVIQIDADLQHDVADIPQFLELANKHPNACICGVPEYDDSVDKGRFYARYITHVWVWIHTWSLDIKDSMCGYRCYPLSAVMPLIDKKVIGERMNFDTDIIVKMYWQGTPVINLPTHVVYHSDVPSNFRMFKDNVAISWTHTKLFFGMLIRIPQLLLKKRKGKG